MIELTAERAATLKSAGYTVYIGYEKFLPLAETWVVCGFPTTDDAIELHREQLAHRVTRGEIRELALFAL